MLEKARRAGCFALFWGVESANQPTVDLLGKGFRTENLHNILDGASDLGIKNYVHLMYNTPHESAEDIRYFGRLVEKYIDSDWVTFLPQRFMLESQSLMFDHPDRYGLLKIKKVEASQFEREQWIYEEIDGIDYDAVELRNERHRKALADHLDRITYRKHAGWISTPFAKAIPLCLDFVYWETFRNVAIYELDTSHSYESYAFYQPRLKEQLLADRAKHPDFMDCSAKNRDALVGRHLCGHS